MGGREKDARGRRQETDVEPPAIPFIPPNASINRVRIVDLPGIAIDDDVRGERADNVLSASAVVRYAQARADALQIPDHLRAAPPDTPEVRRTLPRYVDACLSSPDAKVRATAETIARQLGRNLGHILLTLHRGDAVNRAARTDWTDAEWEHWATIRRVWIGGGQTSGELGRQVMHHAANFLDETGYGTELAVARTPHPRNMALLGAARYLPGNAKNALCLDFGSTMVKRALVHLEEGAITHLSIYPSLPVVWRWRNTPDAGREIAGEDVVDFVAGTIAETVEESRRTGVALDDELIFSVAAYVRSGHLYGNGIYGRMNHLAADARPLLSDAVYERVGERFNVRIIHDGTAASAIHAGEARSAILIIGTAIGVGFPPPSAEGLRPLALVHIEASQKDTPG